MYRARDGRLILSATDLVGFLACGHLTNLERAAAAGLVRTPIRDDPEIELLRKRGYAHEQRYIASLRARGRRVTELPETDAAGERLSLEVRTRQTEEAIRRGDDVIFQATFHDGRWRGHADFLLRAETPSALGAWSYEVADTKLAHSTKPGAILQICSYIEQLERIQGVQPAELRVVLGGAEHREDVYRVADFMAYYRTAKAGFERLIDDAAAPPAYPPIATYPDPVEHCSVCRWFPGECRVRWRKDDALPLVAGISRVQRDALKERRVPTRGVLAVTAIREVEPPLKRSTWPGYERVANQARIQVESDDLPIPKHELLEPERLEPGGDLVPDRGLGALPEPSAGDLFFDIEGDPFAFEAGLEYLFGVHDPGAAGDPVGGATTDGRWHALWALDREQEKAAFERLMDLFIERFERDPGMHIYHYAAYEPTAIKRLAGRHATREEEVDRLLRAKVFVDLYRVVLQGMRVGVESYSIKRLEPLYGYQRTVELRDANSSIVEFERFLEEGSVDGAILRTIEEYNKDDCVSTHLLRDWLEARRPEAERQFGMELPRPVPGDPPSAAVTDRERAVKALEDALTRNLPRDPEAGTAEHATRMLAHLLDWHRREDKATYWRFFDLMSRSDEELLEEREPIAGLKYVGTDGLTKQKLVRHLYTFPVQELDINGSLHDPRLTFPASALGTHELDKDARKLVIKRAADWAGSHPTAVVPLNLIRADAQWKALMALGGWVLEHGIDADAPDWRAGRDLLLGRPPRAGQSPAAALVQPGESGLAAARRLVTTLDDSTLPIQGPPGSGKTYTGARMIVDLVEQGRKVGITANSHKVIGTLLEDSCAEAAKRGAAFRAVQKAEGDQVCDHEFVACVNDNGKFVKTFAEPDVQVGAGTAWLWARPELSGTLDTLFVDEAGQMSLANVVAISGAARNIVLLGDPRQLDQPLQGAHPQGAEVSALAHLLGGHQTIAPDRGIFLERTWRLHPDICRFTSEVFYEGRLQPVEGQERQAIATGSGAVGLGGLESDGLLGSGVRWVGVEHAANTNGSAEEAEAVGRIVQTLLGRDYVDQAGRRRPLTLDDIVIVAPYNVHRQLVTERLPAGARVGTVDKFQGQEAPVSIFSMASSSAEDAPRGMGFLYSLNRLNVATSRARALAIVVCSPALLAPRCKSPAQLRMANALCAFVEAAAGVVDSVASAADHVGSGRRAWSTPAPEG